jgi:outer membrane protein assembly complex protein YaeT
VKPKIKVNQELILFLNIANKQLFRYVLFGVFCMFCLFRDGTARTKEWHVKAIQFHGNTSFSSRDLLGLMYLKPQNIFTKVRFSEWRMRSDVDAIKRFYRSQGFIESKVLISTLNRDTANARVFLTFQIDEGPRTTISAMKVLATDSVIDTSVAIKLSTKYGSFLKSSLIESDVDHLTELLSSKGYLDGHVLPSIQIDTAHYQAKVLYNIKQGPQIRVGDIKLNGLKKLKARYVIRELNFKKGDILTSDRIKKSEQNLYRTNLLNSVQIDHSINTLNLQQLADLKIEECPVTVSVKETDFFKLQMGVGYSYLSNYKPYEGLRAHLESSYSNLFAMGHQIALKTDVAFPEQKGELIYSTPWFFGIPLQFASNLYLDRLTDKVLDSTLILGYELSFSYQTNSHLEYNWRVNWDDMLWFSGIDSSARPKPLTKKIGVDITYDTRNDIIDPSKGLYNLFSADVAGIVDTSTNRYIKVTDDLRFYWNWKHISWGSGLHLGVIYAYDSTHKEIPPLEQFGIGGPKILRGFTQDQLHIDKGLMLSANLIEMRFPLFWWFRGALFADVGNVYKLPSKLKMFEDLRWCVGPGIIVKTPIAIIRMDVGFKLFRPRNSAGGYDESLYEFQFGIGQPF